MLRRATVLAARRIGTQLASNGGSPAVALRADLPAAVSSSLEQADNRFGQVLCRNLFSASPLHADANRRTQSSTTGAAAGAAAQAGPEAGAAAQAASGQRAGPSNGDEAWEPTLEDLQEELERQRAAVHQHEEQAKELKDRLLRSLADMENLRERTARQIDNNKSFAVQSFAKSLLDVADNLERAAAAVPANALGPDEHMTPQDVAKHLRTLLEGVQMTDKQLTEALKAQGVEKFASLGEPFDPAMHNALFEMPDPSRKPGTVGAVTKNGYTLHGRVMRAADVGVVRGASE